MDQQKKMRSRTDPILPLKMKAPVGRKVLFSKITGDTLAVVHAPPDMVFRSKKKGRRSCTMAISEAGTDVIPRLSFKDVFIAGVGC